MDKKTTAGLIKALKKLSPEEKAEIIKMSTNDHDLGSLRSRLRQKFAGGRPQIEKVCQYCNLKMPARAMWKHEAACYAAHNLGSPRRRGRPPTDPKP